MKHDSPLRYPGGKAALAGLLIQIRKLNRLGDRPMAEPFAGGAGASLRLLFLEETSEIFLNDVDPAIHDLWWTIVNRPKQFVKLLDDTNISLAEWNRQREIYRYKGRLSRLKRGFAAFYLNRCNRSGIIINGGPIGGMNQTGKWKLDARYNKTELRRRCVKVAEYHERIHVSGQDGIEFIGSLDNHPTFFFIDPPYFIKGETLYLNTLNQKYHAALANKLESIDDTAWVLTYDDSPEIRKMYSGWATIRSFSLRYSASERRYGQELLIVPRWMQLPASQPSAALNW